MSFSVQYLTEMYQKAWDAGVRASNNNRIGLAKKSFEEAAGYLNRLAKADPGKAPEYTARAERLTALAAKMGESLAADRKNGTMASSSGGGGYEATAPGGTDAASGASASPDAGTPSDMSQYLTFFDADTLPFGFDGVIGLEEAKAAVTEYVINPARYPEAYNYDFIDNKCILLEGPPGTGKTTFAKAVAKELRRPFLLVNVAALVSCYVGETGKTVDRVFSWMRRYAAENQCGITVFFDEFDEIAKSRAGDDKASQTAVPALLRNLDGMQENRDFLILANTNCREMLDPGILSRFRRKINIPLPDASMRERFFRDKLKQLEPEYIGQLRFEELAAATEGFSGRTITQLCDDYLHFIGGVKAGLHSCTDYHQALIDIIHQDGGRAE